MKQSSITEWRDMCTHRVLAKMSFILICCLFVFSPLGANAGDRFVEISTDRNMTTYDMATLQTIVPGRFTVISTTIDNPDVIKLKMTAMEMLITYCEKPSGHYQAPTNVLTLGHPDMPIEKIKVESGFDESLGTKYPRKMVSWHLPYSKFGIAGSPYSVFFRCKYMGNTISQERAMWRTQFLSGYREKTMYDCKRALMGTFLNEETAASQAIVMDVKGGYFRDYTALCQNLGFTPYLP